MDHKPAPPKKPLTAFFLFKADKFHGVKAANPDLKITELVKLIADMWYKISPEEKEVYEQKNVEAKKAYEQAMEEYVKAYGPIEKKIRVKKSKKASPLETPPISPFGSSESSSEDEDEDDEEEEEIPQKKMTQPLPPKRPFTAFFLYKQDKFAEVKKANPDAKVTDITKIISHMWANIEQDEKTFYQQRYDKLKATFVKDMEAYEQAYGPIEKKVYKKKIPSISESPSESSSDEEVPVKPKSFSQNKPAPPKRPLTAFFLFKEDKYSEFKNANPDLKVTDIVKLLAKAWSELDPASKEIYEQKHIQAKIKYQETLAAYNGEYKKEEVYERED